jgi:formylglycine-generating enzyme required for sulfatase activity
VWKNLPVVGVSWEDALAYEGWLDRTGRVPGARPCSEHEWERAARGPDARLYPHGDRLLADDAAFDETYGRTLLAYGPDEAGAHPRSASPFGVLDLSGNVWEATQGVGSDGNIILRGGSWYQDQFSARVDMRDFGEPTQRTVRLGVRVCADSQ